jgi:hypothetical protein
MRRAALVVLTPVAVALLLLVAKWAQLHVYWLELRPGVGFWLVLVVTVGLSFVLFYRLLWRASSPAVLVRIVVSFALAVATYFVAINIAFSLATFIFGA